jgi:hypothetical protein
MAAKDLCRRTLGGLVLVFALTACAGEPVALATDSENLGCFVANTTGLLVPDATAGTAIVSEDMAESTAQVLWPAGYTARRSGGEIEVLDRGGLVVARTGQRYELLGGYNRDGQWIACDDGVYPPLWPSPR